MPINRIDQRLQHSAHECPHITTGIVGNFVEIGIVPILHLSSDRRFQAEYGTCGLSLRVADSTGSSSLTAGSRHGWPVCQYARGCVKRSATHHCGSACMNGAFRFVSHTLQESQNHKLASRVWKRARLTLNAGELRFRLATKIFHIDPRQIAAGNCLQQLLQTCRE